jgi:chromosome segregation ATPase
MLAQTSLEKEQLKGEQVERHVKELRHELKAKKALLRKVEKEYGPLFEKRHELEAVLGTVKTNLALTNKEYEDLRADVDESKKRIEAKMRERDLLNKDVVLAEEKERDKGDAIQTLEGELKKLQNKIQGYKAEAQKLQKLIYQLEKDKQKYGIEASQANAKYYQCLEQVKLKNNLITKLQKKNIEAEGRLKQQ